MAQKIQNKQEHQIDQAPASSFEVFIKKYEKIISWTVIAALVIVFGALAISKWYTGPKKEEAKGQMFNAEQQFAAGNYAAALNGDGNFLGFAEIAKEYGKKAGAAVYLYEGICNLQLGNNQEAIDCLKKYNGKDEILKARALCCTGDAYANLGNNQQALAFYDKAISAADNAFTAGYLLKAGRICEEMGQNDKALAYYDRIKVNYPQTLEALDVDKYISRINAK